MQACTEHVSYQLPNELTRVRYLINAIENDDAGLQAAMAGVEQDTGIGGMRSDFEKAAAHLLPKDPVVKKRIQAKRSAAEISAVGAETTKHGIGSSGVHLRYHTPEEYGKLTKSQKKELSDWRKANPNGNDGEKKPATSKKRQAKFVASIEKKVKKSIEEKLKGEESKKCDDEAAKAYIMSLFSSTPPPAATSQAVASVSAAAAVPAPTGPPSIIKVPNNEVLRGILKRAHENGKK